MIRKCFYSFHYKKDAWRASQVRNIGAVEGNKPVNDNEWEKVWKAGDQAIENWIDDQMKGRSCTIVLIGKETVKNKENRKWINYEIEQSWKKRMGLVGIYIHGLKDENGATSSKGDNPFEYIFDAGRKKLSSSVRCYDPSGSSSDGCYALIAAKIEELVRDANFRSVWQFEYSFRP